MVAVVVDADAYADAVAVAAHADADANAGDADAAATDVDAVPDHTAKPAPASAVGSGSGSRSRRTARRSRSALVRNGRTVARAEPGAASNSVHSASAPPASVHIRFDGDGAVGDEASEEENDYDSEKEVPRDDGTQQPGGDIAGASPHQPQSEAAGGADAGGSWLKKNFFW